jgi:hypothetical protein
VKERIKRFYQENKFECIYVGGILSLTAAFVAGAVMAADGTKVVQVGDKTEDGLHKILVVHKNGFWQIWDRPIAE